MTRTAAELSIVCAEERVPGGAIPEPQPRSARTNEPSSGTAGVRADVGWRCLELAGPFDLSATGILLSVLAPLAEAQVAIFALATFDTDYVLVRAAQLPQAVAALRAVGHRVE